MRLLRRAYSEEAYNFAKAELAHRALTQDVEYEIIRKTQKKFGLSEETAAAIFRVVLLERAGRI